MFCPNCGKQIDDDAKFCEHCGAVIKTSTISNEKSEQSGVTSKKVSVKKRDK
ncbi:MAG: zinc-ribbon domain-containing protein [Ruminococcus flavefaciens]|nr:zinc-ribbon domain-containing protein [Ruminococcus flavefaciens]MCM1061459.1 zinc-ribbon domain-containing protein [Eubacterium sp.]